MTLIAPPPPIPKPPSRAADTERVFLRTASFGVPPNPPKDHAYFLRMLDRDLEPNWIAGLKQSGGYELINGFAGVGARVSETIYAWSNGTIAGYASIGAYAAGWVYLARPTADAGAGVVKAGTIVGTPDRRMYRTRADVTFDADDLGPFPTPIRAVATGAEYNVQGEVVTELGDAVPGQITEIYRLLEDPDFFDSSITVRQVADVEGGSDPFLEQLGEDRGVDPRLPGEQEDSYRFRVKAIADGVAPAGIELSIVEYLRLWSPFFDCVLIDGWDWEYQTAYDPLGGDAPEFPETTFLYDDPRPPGATNRWLSDEQANGGAFILALPELPCLRCYAMILSDPGRAPEDFQTAMTDGGQRAYNVLSAPRDLPPEILPAGLSGVDAAVDAAYSGAVSLAENLKSAGVSVDAIIATLE